MSSSNKAPQTSAAGSEDDWWLVPAGMVFVVVAATQLWRVKVKPWLVEHTPLQADGGIATADLVGVAVMVVPVLVLLLLVRWWWRSRRNKQDQEA